MERVQTIGCQVSSTSQNPSTYFITTSSSRYIHVYSIVFNGRPTATTKTSSTASSLPSIRCSSAMSQSTLKLYGVSAHNKAAHQTWSFVIFCPFPSLVAKNNWTWVTCFRNLRGGILSSNISSISAGVRHVISGRTKYPTMHESTPVIPKLSKVSDMIFNDASHTTHKYPALTFQTLSISGTV